MTAAEKAFEKIGDNWKVPYYARSSPRDAAEIIFAWGFADGVKYQKAKAKKGRK